MPDASPSALTLSPAPTAGGARPVRPPGGAEIDERGRVVSVCGVRRESSAIESDPCVRAHSFPGSCMTLLSVTLSDPRPARRPASTL